MKTLITEEISQEPHYSEPFKITKQFKGQLKDSAESRFFVDCYVSFMTLLYYKIRDSIRDESTFVYQIRNHANESLKNLISGSDNFDTNKYNTKTAISDIEEAMNNLQNKDSIKAVIKFISEIMNQMKQALKS